MLPAESTDRMEIKANNNIDPIARAMANPVKAATPKTATDAAAFEHANSLEQALRSSPDARPEVVARAKELIGDVTYPPQETIQQIATLIAANTSSTRADSSNTAA